MMNTTMGAVLTDEVVPRLRANVRSVPATVLPDRSLLPRHPLTPAPAGACWFPVLKIDEATLEKLEQAYAGIRESIMSLEDAELPACGRCGVRRWGT